MDATKTTIKQNKAVLHASERFPKTCHHSQKSADVPVCSIITCI